MNTEEAFQILGCPAGAGMEIIRLSYLKKREYLRVQLDQISGQNHLRAVKNRLEDDLLNIETAYQMLISLYDTQKVLSGTGVNNEDKIDPQRPRKKDERNYFSISPVLSYYFLLTLIFCITMLGIYLFTSFYFKKSSLKERSTGQADPGYASYYLRWGNEKMDIEDYASAYHEFTRAIELNPEFDSAWCSRGICNFFLEKNDEAILDFTRCLSLNPLHESALFNRGQVYYAAGLYVQAIEDCSKAIGINPQYDVAYTVRGLSKLEIHDGAGALSDCLKAVTLSENEYYCLRNLSEVQYRLKSYDKAIANASQAIAVDPENWEGYSWRGKYYCYAGDYYKSADDLQKAISLCPENEALDVYIMLSLCHFKYRQPGQAVITAEQGLSIFKNDPGLLLILGYIYLDLGYYPVAADKFRASADFGDQEDYDCFLGLSLASYKLGNTGKAKKYFMKAVDLVPDLGRGADGLRKVIDSVGEFWSDKKVGMIQDMIKDLNI